MTDFSFSATPWGDQLARGNALLEQLKNQRYLTTRQVDELQEIMRNVHHGFRHILEATGNVLIHLGNVVQEVQGAISEFDPSAVEDDVESSDNTDIVVPDDISEIVDADVVTQDEANTDISYVKTFDSNMNIEELSLDMQPNAFGETIRLVEESSSQTLPAYSLSSSVSEIDRNARAYGFEVGYGAALAETIGVNSPQNPFLKDDWREHMDEWNEERDGNLVAHARRELALIGEEPDVIEMYIRTIRGFASYGHSGGSASIAIPVINQLLQYKALSPLTANPGEWNEVGSNLWQNARQSDAFSEDGGQTYYILDEVGPDGERIVHESQQRP